jgi:predicted Zn-dependent peptidase
MTNEQRFTLSNGVRVLIEELPYVQSVSFGFWVDVGSKVEPRELNGICHFIEHMLFKGTSRRSALDIAQSLEVSGGSLNAFTDKENTCFYARVLASELPIAIDVLADMLLNSKLDAAEIKREKDVIIEEIKMYEDDPDEFSHDLLIEKVWADHPLGQPVAGTKTSVRGLTRDAILSFMADHYAPENLVIAIAGKVDTDRALHQLEATVGKMKPGKGGTTSTPAAHTPGVTVKYRDIEQVHRAIATPAVPIGAQDRYPVAGLNSILGGGMASRLFQEVREKRGLVYSIGSYDSLYRPAGLFGVSAGLSPKHLGQVLELTHAELAKARQGDLTEDELSLAKQQLKGALLLSLESPRHRMNRMAHNELFYGRAVTPEEVLADVDAVTLADLNRLSATMFDPATFTTVIVGPLKRLPRELAWLTDPQTHPAYVTLEA